MKYFLFFILFFINSLALSQFFIQSKVQKNIIAGFHTFGQGAFGKDPVSGEKAYISDISIDPYIGYFFNRGIGVGITADFEFIRSSHIPNQTLYGVGLFTRYYFLFLIKKKF